MKLIFLTHQSRSEFVAERAMQWKIPLNYTQLQIAERVAKMDQRCPATPNVCREPRTV